MLKFFENFLTSEFLSFRRISLRRVKNSNNFTIGGHERSSKRSFKVIYQTENLGEVLRGDRIVNTMYDIRVDKSETCSVLCTQDLSPENADAFREKILNQYSVHLLADNLPVATKWELEGKARAGLLGL